MVNKQPHSTKTDDFSARWRILLAVMMLAMVTLIGRAIHLQVLDKQFLQEKGNLRHAGVTTVPAHRGRILDRNGELLAESTPLKSIWINARQFLKADIRPEQVKFLASGPDITTEDIAKEFVYSKAEPVKKNDGDKLKLPEKLKLLSAGLDMPMKDILKIVGSRQGRGFSCLKKGMIPDVADQISSLKLPGIYSYKEFRRYYPSKDETAHIIGFTDIEGHGQEGMELGFDKMLKGTDGAKKVLRDGHGNIIEVMEEITQPVPGQDLTLSIDERLQHLAFREVKNAYLHHRARAASAVLLDSHTGEVLAMVNLPSFNPNNRQKIQPNLTRNRAMTDLFEPGSTMKPLAVACALELGLTRPGTVINTNPGLMHVGSNIVKDGHNYGVINVARVLQKSSNVGVTKIALAIPPKKFWAFYNNLGFGQPLQTGFPGEASGHLSDYHGWNPFKQATLSFGYGVSTTPLQLARAYLSIANNGMMPMVSLQKLNNPPETIKIMSSQTAKTVRSMLEGVVSHEGTAIRAAVPGFKVAGKTGTVKKAGSHGYSNSLYMSVFAGVAPASNPRLVMVVMVDEPSNGEYYGGEVAAPIFSNIMGEALRILNIAPDAPLSPIMASGMDEPA